jgi:hypothetical protein
MKRPISARPLAIAVVALTASIGGCQGKIGQAPSGAGGGGEGGATTGTTTGAGGGSNTGAGGSGSGSAGAAFGTDGGAGGAGAGAGGGFTTALATPAVLRKVKSVLTGLAPTDSELAAATDATALESLIDTWMATPEFNAKMIGFFQNAFQQSSISLLDYEFQLRKRPGAFDLPYGLFGDNAFPLLIQNLKESFARTCLELIAEGRPLTDILTTTRFMMTTALMSMYMQIEMPYDIHTFNWQFNQGTRPALADTLNPSSPNYMIWGYAAPTTTTGKGPGYTTCAGDSTKVSTFPGSTNLFHVLLGVIDRDSSSNGQGSTNLGCFEHAIQPYFTASDLSDWRMVTIANSGTPPQSYDLPTLRGITTTLPSKLPRVSFFTTPSFLAIWNTNDSNQHRVTANQALLGALGQGFTNPNAAIPTPPSSIGLDGTHAVTGSVCYACHKSLDPMKQFWANSFDYNDQVNTKPGTMASFGFGNVQQNGSTLVDFGTFVGQVTDSQADPTVNRFALAMTQKLCFFANSAQCEETDPAMRQIAADFQNANYDFKTLVRELLSSPLVTASADTATFDEDGITISITRRDQLCAALANRLAKPDICSTAVPSPPAAASAMNLSAGAISADGFSRGTPFPVTPSDPNLFYRASSELLCEAVAAKVVDATSGTVYTSANYQTAIPDIVAKVMGMPSTDPHYAAAVSALQSHYSAALATKATATSALRSTFAAACQSPTSLALGI